MASIADYRSLTHSEVDQLVDMIVTADFGPPKRGYEKQDAADVHYKQELIYVWQNGEGTIFMNFSIFFDELLAQSSSPTIRHVPKHIEA